MADPHPPAMPKKQSAFDFGNTSGMPSHQHAENPAKSSRQGAVKATPTRRTVKPQTGASERNPAQTRTGYLTVHQVAAFLGISRATVWRWTALRPDFPAAVKFGPGTTRWARDDIRAFAQTSESRTKGKHT